MSFNDLQMLRKQSDPSITGLDLEHLQMYESLKGIDNGLTEHDRDFKCYFY